MNIDLNNVSDLGDFFSVVGKAKKQKEEEFKSVVGEIDIDDIFNNLKEENKKLKKKKEKEKRQIKQLEEFLFNSTKEDSKESKILITEEQYNQNPVEVLEKELILLDNISYDSIDKLMKGICAQYNILPKKLHNDFVEKHGMIPDEWIKLQKKSENSENKENDTDIKEIEKVEEEIEESGKDHVEEAIKLLEKISDNSEDNIEITDIDVVRREVKELRNLIYKSLETVGGGGEVRLEFLDDVDRDSVKTDGYFIQYNTSTQKFVGAAVTGGGGGGSQTLDEVLSLGNTSSAGMSVGVITSTNFIGDLSGNSDTSFFSINSGISTSSQYALVSGLSTYSNYAAVAGISTNSNLSTYSIYSETAGISTESAYALSSGISTNSEYSLISGISSVSQNLTGTPDITVGIITASSAFFSGNVSISGTITYDDVTNVDSIGLITARSGIEIGPLISIASTLFDNGSAFFSGIVTALGFSGDLTGNSDTSTYSLNSGISTYSSISGISTYAEVAGISTYSNFSLVSGISTNSNNSDRSDYADLAGISTYSNYSASAGLATDATNANYAIYAGTAGIATNAANADVATYAVYAANAGLATDATNSTRADYADVSGVSTYSTYSASAGISTNADVATYANYAANAGFATDASYSILAGVSTYSIYANSSGISTYANYSASAGISTNSDVATYAIYSSSSGISTYAINSGISTNVNGGTGNLVSLNVSGISTFVGVSTFQDDVFIGGNLNIIGTYGLQSKYTHQKIISTGSLSETLDVNGRTSVDIIVFVNGIAFLPEDDYTVSGTTLTFTETPINGSRISIRYLPL